MTSACQITVSGDSQVEIRCKSTAFQTKRSLKNKERAINLHFVDNFMHFAKSSICTFDCNANVFVRVCY